MAIKVYISGICGSHEVRKHQQRVLFILQGLSIDLQLIDITEPGREEDLAFMQEEAKKHDKKTQLPPQIFNDNKYCGDYADFELANDDDEIMKFLKLEAGSSKSEVVKEMITQNGFNDSVNKEEDSLSDSILNNAKVNGESNEIGDEVIEEKDTLIDSSEKESEIADDSIKNVPEEDKAELSEGDKNEEEEESE